MKSISFIDLEVQADSGKVLDYGAIKSSGATHHGSVPGAFSEFLSGTDFVCGHNLIDHDSRYISEMLNSLSITSDRLIDTLPLSALLFPKKPYHALLKDEKFFSEELNNPLNDSIKSRDLFYDEIAAYEALDIPLQRIYWLLLSKQPEFVGFFQYLNLSFEGDTAECIRGSFSDDICRQAALHTFIAENPVALAYCLANIRTRDPFSLLPKWIIRNYPDTERIMHLLRSVPCVEGCPYCSGVLDPHRGLKRFFGYDAFRKFNDQPLQENAVRAAIHGKSLLAVFPTGGGKSITYQIPALISSEAEKGLTVILSPLQSLMKDQVDNLEKAGIHEAVTINGLVDPLERARAIERIAEGNASILYISPESLRSKTIERLLTGRKIVRFVIDEAHCFSAWGQDFRIDYLYIGKFLKKLKELKCLAEPIPVSCFTATAKQSVIEDIRNYFREQNGLELDLIQTSVARVNLNYHVILKLTDDEKYQELRSLLEQKNCPTIIYVNRTKRAEELAKRLTGDGLPAKPYHDR